MEELTVIKRERYHPELIASDTDKLPLNPIPNFTDNKLYDIYEEVKQANFRPPSSGIRYKVKDDTGKVRFISCEYFHKDPILLWDNETEKRLASVQKQELCDARPEYWSKVKHTMDQMDKAAKGIPVGQYDELMVDLRREHSAKTAHHYAGIPTQSIPDHMGKACCLEDVAELEANSGLAETKILAGLKRNKNSFEVIDELVTSLERQINVLNGNLLTLRVEVQMLKKMALYR